MTYELLKNAPPHDSPEFIEYLRKNNPVIFENDHWIIIENCKYHTAFRPWLTAFHIGHDHWTDCVYWLVHDYEDWEWLKKDKSRQTVERFHVHLYRNE